MCVPVPPNLMLSLAMNGLKMMQDNQENKALIDQQNQQNRIAKANAIRLMAQEDLRIRQEKEEALDKQAQVESDRRKAQARAEVEAGEGGVSGVSVDRLMMDFLRQEGEYKSSVLNNLQYEIAQSKENKRAISMGQEANSTYVNRSVLLPTFANAGLRFAGDYLSYRTKQLEKDKINEKASKLS